MQGGAKMALAKAHSKDARDKPPAHRAPKNYSQALTPSSGRVSLGIVLGNVSVTT